MEGRRRATGGRTLVGASPEVHVRMSGGTVVMNPISGTYRYPAGGPTPEDLLAFLADRKETDELSMVVDEELKMMATVAPTRSRLRPVRPLLPPEGALRRAPQAPTLVMVAPPRGRGR